MFRIRAVINIGIPDLFQDRIIELKRDENNVIGKAIE